MVFRWFLVTCLKNTYYHSHFMKTNLSFHFRKTFPLFRFFPFYFPTIVQWHSVSLTHTKKCFQNEKFYSCNVWKTFLFSYFSPIRYFFHFLLWMFGENTFIFYGKGVFKLIFLFSFLKNTYIKKKDKTIWF